MKIKHWNLPLVVGGLITIGLLISVLAITGCDEANMMKPVAPVDGTDPGEPTDPTTNGEVKQPEPTEPSDPPTVTEVGWYSDWQLKQSVVGDAHAGDTLYIKVVFSEPVAHIVADDATARPAIGLIVNDVAMRFRVVASGASLQSGDCKPLQSGTDDYICKYTVPADTTGTLTLQVNGTAVSTLDIATPTVAIGSAVQENNGSVTVSGTSTDIPEGTTVTVTLGDTVTATATTDSAGAWTVTVPAIEAETLTAGTVAITATATDATATGSVEYVVATTYGIPTPTQAERIQVEILVGVLGEDISWLSTFYKTVERWYGGLFDVETEQGRELYQRFAKFEYKKSKLATNPPPIEEELKLVDQYFEEAYGISADYARWLVYNIYLDEKPEDEHLLGKRWQKNGIAMEYLLLQTANPNATEEKLEELLRESIRAGKVTIVSQY